MYTHLLLCLVVLVVKYINDHLLFTVLRNVLTSIQYFRPNFDSHQEMGNLYYCEVFCGIMCNWMLSETTLT